VEPTVRTVVAWPDAPVVDVVALNDPPVVDHVIGTFGTGFDAASSARTTITVEAPATNDSESGDAFTIDASAPARPVALMFTVAPDTDAFAVFVPLFLLNVQVVVAPPDASVVVWRDESVPSPTVTPHDTV
jgi:hypothetical protein